MILPIGRPALMGILNVTPDSFSDGGSHFSYRSAVDAGLRMLDEGADILDVGGESTRPGAQPVSEAEELRRVIPVIEELCRRGAVVSVDTMKAALANRALQAGAQIVNDVSALADPEMLGVCAEASATVCLVHMQGRPQTMQVAPHYEDVVTEIRDSLWERTEFAVAGGIDRARIWIDPGIGFGKTVAHNLEILRDLTRFVELGFPVLVGVSRKGFIGQILGATGVPLPVDERLEGTLAVQASAQMSGVRIIRAHDVKSSRRTIDMLAAILHA